MTTPSLVPSAHDPAAGLAGLRVFIVLTSLELGGAERQALHLASWLQDRCRAEVGIVALYGGTGAQPLRGMCRERRLACLRVSMPEHVDASPTFHSIRQFAREMRVLRPDVLLPYTSLPNVLCGAAWRSAGAKVCIWNQRDEGRELPRQRWQLAAIRNTKCFISNSRAGIDCLVRQWAVPMERTHLVFNGVAMVQPVEAPDTLRRRLGIDPAARVGVMVANIHRFKDHPTLVRAWSLVCQRSPGPRPVLLLAGRQDDAQPIAALARELGIEDAVRFLGPVADVAGLLGAADVAVFSSEHEGTPNAVLEAMAAGRPVVATDIPGCRDALGETYRFLTPPRDAPAFAERICALLGDHTLRQEIGTSLHRRVREVFTVEKMCRETCRIIEEQWRRANKESVAI